MIQYTQINGLVNFRPYCKSGQNKEITEEITAYNIIC